MSSCVWMPSRAVTLPRAARVISAISARQRSAVGVAERHDVGARSLGGLPGGERVLAVVLVAVERVFGVVDDEPAVVLQMSDRVSDHREVLLGRRLQNLPDVQQPRLAEDGDDRRLGLDEQPDLIVLLHADVLAARRAERRQSRVPERAVFRLLEELDVLGIGARPAAFDVVHAERVEALGDAQLVRDGERDALALRAVAQRRVVDFDLSGHPCNLNGLKPASIVASRRGSRGRSRPRCVESGDKPCIRL